MNNIKAYAVETIDGATKFFDVNEIEEAHRLFDSRGSSMFALYMHHAQLEPVEALESLQAENKGLKSQLNSAKHLLENQRLLLEEYSFNCKHLPSIESEREANQILTNENQNLDVKFTELQQFSTDLIAENAGLKNQRDELLEALINLVKNQEEGWRASNMPESHIQEMPYLKEARTAIARAKGEE